MTNPSRRGRRLQKLGSKEHDLLRSSFYARTSAEELKCPARS